MILGSELAAATATKRRKRAAGFILIAFDDFSFEYQQNVMSLICTEIWPFIYHVCSVCFLAEALSECLWIDFEFDRSIQYLPKANQENKSSCDRLHNIHR